MKRCLSFLLALVLVLTLVPAYAFADGDMHASELIKSYIKSKEGLALTAYINPGETNYTIGYGHCATDIYPGMTITEAQANAYFEQDIKRFEKGVNDFAKKYNQKLTQNEFDAMFSLCYNFGETWYDYYTGWRLSTYMKNGYKNYPKQEIADAMAVLCSAGGILYKGLVERRLQEANLLLYGDSPFEAYDKHFVYISMDAGSYSISTGNRVAVFTKGEPYGKLPTVSRSGYYFAGWKASDGTVITNSTVATNSYWNVTPVWSTTPPVPTYQLTVNGGSGSGSYTAGTVVKLVPDSKPGYVFTGWSGDITPTKNSDGSYSVTMPKKSITVTANFAVSKCQYGDDCPSKSFTDVSKTFWAHAEIDYAISMGLFKGTSATTFAPDMEMNRGMLVTVLYRLAGSPSVAGLENEFPDVVKNAYYDAILWAHANNIAHGFNDGTFRPNDPITREQFATFLQRFAANIYNFDTESAHYADLSRFTDAAEVDTAYRESMSWAVGEGIINGTSSTTLSPNNCATRAQVAVILCRFTSNA